MTVTVVLLVLAASCSLFKQDIQVLQTFELRIDQPADTASQFSVQKDVDTNTEKVQQYADDISAYLIKKITFKVKDYEGNHDPFLEGTIEFAPAGSSEFTVLSTVTGLHLKDMSEQEYEGQVVVPDDKVGKRLTHLLQNGSPITFRLNAVTNHSPVAATLVVNIETQMTVDI